MTPPHSPSALPAGAPVSQRDRRRFKRVVLRLPGRYLNASSEEHLLETANLSCDGALVEAASKPRPGEQIVCYVDGLGRVVGRVVRLTPQGFAVRFQTNAAKRDKLADRITWLANKDTLGLGEEREAERFQVNGQTQVILSDGRAVTCRVTDLSLMGAAFEATGLIPRVGDRVRIGQQPAEIVRVTGRDFAVRYLFGRAARDGLSGS